MPTSPNPLTRGLGLLLTAGGTGLVILGMLTLSLPRMVAGAVLWALGMLLGGRAWDG